MKVGAMVLATLGVEETLDLAVRAENLGFESFWLNDADIVYRNTWPMLAAIARETKRIKFGPCVTNFVTRPWVFVSGLMNTLQELSGGRLILGVGRGDASVRVLGKRAMSPSEFRASLARVRAFLSGDEVDADGTAVRTTFLSATDVPILGAGYGPVVLQVIGELCDGAIIQAADPDLISWSKSLLGRGAARVGRSLDDVPITVAAPAYVTDDVDQACERLRWFGDVVGRHIAGLLSRPHPGLPDGIAALGRLHSGDAQRAERLESVEGDYGNFPDEAVRRVVLAGPVGTHLARLTELEERGVERVILYLNHDRRVETLESYASDIIPVLARSTTK